MLHRTSIALCAAAIMMLTVGCSSTVKPIGAKTVEYDMDGKTSAVPVNEAQLQQELLRFEGRFGSRIVNAMHPFITSPHAKIHAEALRSVLRLRSSAMDIAIGPSPPTNLLDMVAFVELTRAAAYEMSVPMFYKGEAGKEVLKAFDESSKDIWTVAGKVLNANQQATLKKVIADYHKANPNILYAESIRLSDFAEISGARAEQAQVSGMLASVEGAVKEADAARLLGERVLYYGQRAPFLLRFHAQVLSEDIVKQVTRMVLATAVDEQSKLEQRINLASTRVEELIRVRTHELLRAGYRLIFLLFIAAIAARVIGSYLAFNVIEKRRDKISEARSREGRKAA